MEVLNDILGYKNRKIYQNTDFFSFSLDSVMLANFVSIRMRDKKILDLCSGNGVIPLVLSLRTSNEIDGVELQTSLCDLANKSIKYNKLSNQINIINADIKHFSLNNEANKYDVIVCNPPYFKYDKNSIVNESMEKLVARHEIKVKLSEIFSISKKLLKDGGNFAIVHRTERLVEILNEFKKNNIEPKRIRFVYENINKPSTLVLIEGSLNGNDGLKIESPFILYNVDGTKSEEYSKFLLEVK